MRNLSECQIHSLRGTIELDYVRTSERPFGLGGSGHSEGRQADIGLVRPAWARLAATSLGICSLIQSAR